MLFFKGTLCIQMCEDLERPRLHLLPPEPKVVKVETNEALLGIFFRGSQYNETALPFFHREK